MRFFYYYPTFDRPSGGNKQLRLQATLLRELGVETFLLRDRRFFDRGGGFDDNSFYGVDVETAPFPFEGAGGQLRPDDVVVLPEVLLEQSLHVCRGWPVRLAVNNQNGFYGLRYGPPARDCRRLEFAIANAPYVVALSRRFLGLPPERVFLVPHWVVRPPFDLAADDGPRDLAVCYMPRKLPELVRQVCEQVSQTVPDVPWVKIDGLPEPEVARRFRRNLVFFAAQDLEGCPLPALEAMACGCLVAGFAGTAGFPHPYATPANGFWAPDRDVGAAADAVRAAIRMARTGGDESHRYREAGRQTALRFRREAVRTALGELVEAVSGQSYAARRTRPVALGWRGRLYAYRLLYDYDKLGLAGSMLGWVSRPTKPLRRAFSRPSETYQS